MERAHYTCYFVYPFIHLFYLSFNLSILLCCLLSLTLFGVLVFHSLSLTLYLFHCFIPSLFQSIFCSVFGSFFRHVSFIRFPAAWGLAARPMVELDMEKLHVTSVTAGG